VTARAKAARARVVQPLYRRHGHVFDGDGFCRICQEHRDWLRATPPEPLTPQQVLAEAAPANGRRARAPTDTEWAQSLLDDGPPDERDTGEPP
jgi:hypothetical protein